MRSGYSYVPYSSLESVIENSKEGYYLALRQTQKTIRSDEPDWQPWTLYFLRALQQQKRRLEKKIERERLILGALPELSLQIIDAVKERGRITIGEIVNLTGANRNTVKKHLAALVAENYLTQAGTGKGTWYGGKKVLDDLFDELFGARDGITPARPVSQLGKETPRHLNTSARGPANASSGARSPRSAALSAAMYAARLTFIFCRSCPPAQSIASAP